jgi:hypothetical protein
MIIDARAAVAELTALLAALEAERDAHTATAVADGRGGWYVSCPHGCRLGTTAHAPDADAAARRIALHRDCTRP